MSNWVGENHSPMTKVKSPVDAEVVADGGQVWARCEEVAGKLLAWGRGGHDGHDGHDGRDGRDGSGQGSSFAGGTGGGGPAGKGRFGKKVFLPNEPKPGNWQVVENNMFMKIPRCFWW